MGTHSGQRHPQAGFYLASLGFPAIKIPPGSSEDGGAEGRVRARRSVAPGVAAALPAGTFSSEGFPQGLAARLCNRCSFALPRLGL